MAERLEDLRMEFRCVKCGQPIVVPVRWMGRLVRCTKCQAANRVGRIDEQAAGDDDGLRLPTRVSHARYLEEAEQTMAAGVVKHEPPKARWGWLVWGLIALNVAVAIGAGLLLAMKMLSR